MNIIETKLKEIRFPNTIVRNRSGRRRTIERPRKLTSVKKREKN